jgi:hypothetical protein
MNRAAPFSILIVCLALFGVASGAAQPQGGYSAAQLYNRANAYARSGKPGLAVLNYERARLLTPDDPDIDANLRRVRETSGLPPVNHRAFERMAALVSPRILAWVGVLGLLMSGISLLARVGRKTHRRKLLAVALAGTLLVAVSAANAVALWPIIHQAVVITPSTPVRVSPVTTEEPLFVLPEASLVTPRAQHEEFVLVQTNAGRSGWVPLANLARIVPQR